jgi:ABC-2 type transport system ATP-binding protein
MIEVVGLTKKYGSNLAVDNISFSIQKGEIVGFLGPNGAGKSTTMNMLTGCLAPTEGSIRINGFDMFDRPIKAKKCIGYLPELPPLYGEMTPFEYLCFVAEAKGVGGTRALRQVQEAMELTGIDDLRDRLIKNLSKGCRQRVGIAQAMLGNPDIIILDEPTVGLDPKQIIDIRDLIRHLGHSRTVIISSHILSEISEICDEILVISNGQLVASGTQDELQAMMGQSKLLHLVVRGDEDGVREVLGTIEGVGEIRMLTAPTPDQVALDVTVNADELRDAIFFAMAERKYAVLTMEMEEQSLEKIFLTLTDNAKPAAPETADDDGVQEDAAEPTENQEAEEDDVQ